MADMPFTGPTLLERDDEVARVRAVLVGARSRVRLAQGRADDALADALEVGRRYERLRIRRAVPPWRSLAAVLLAARGRRSGRARWPRTSWSSLSGGARRWRAGWRCAGSAS